MLAALFLGLAWLAAAGPVGGGFLNGGLDGEYFANADLAGPPAFTRRDVRVDFDWGTLGRAGGSPSPGFRDVGSDQFSVRWTGRLSPRFSETYTFTLAADDGARLLVKRTDEATFTVLIDAWTSPGTHTASFSATERALYDVRIEYRELTGAANVSLRWSSPSTPGEVVESASLAALNIYTYEDEMWANAMDSARDEWRDVGFGNDQTVWPNRDTNGWPLGDGAIIVWEGAEPSTMRGTYRLAFRGRAEVTAQGTAAEFFVNGVSVGNTLPAGMGWDATVNVTTADVTIVPVNILFLYFRNTRREAGDPTATGVSEVKLMRPRVVGGTEPQPLGARYDEGTRRAFRRYNALRWISNFETERVWSDRVLPAYSSHRGGGTLRHWELMVLLANETGKDLFACLPHRADDDYVRRVAKLLRYGSDGVNPYDAPQANPVFPPLNSNLRAYVERGNEIWNFSFSQGPENAADGEREVQTATTNGVILNFDGRNRTGDQFYRWHALRSLQMSEIFREVWGVGAMGDRIRFLLEYQYDNFQGTAENALDFLDRYFNNGDGLAHIAQPHPVKHYFWGAGGATYYSSGNSQGTQTNAVVENGSLETPAIANGVAVETPVGSGWSFAGTAGIYRRAEASPALTAQNFGPAGNAVTERRALGLHFTTGAQPLGVHELGRHFPAGGHGRHELWLLRASDGATFAYAEIHSGSRESAGFVTARLGAPAVLPPNTSYYLLSSESPGGDPYHDATTTMSAIPGVTVDGAASATFGNPSWDTMRWTTSTVGGPGTAFGPLTLGVASAPVGTLEFPPDPPAGNQAMWLAGTGSVTRVVNFPAPGVFALRFQAAAKADHETGVRFHVDEQNFTPRGESHLGPTEDHWVPGIGFARNYRVFENNGSFVFTITNAGPHTLRIAATGFPRYYNPFDVQVDPSLHIYFDALELVSPDAIFAGGIPSGGEANGQPSELTGSHEQSVWSQARYAQAYGLNVVAYEGGWSLGGDFGAVPIQNWAKFRDPRATQTAVDSMDIFARSGGALYTWGTYTTWPHGAMEDADEFPLTVGVDQHASALAPEPQNGIHIPATLTPGRARWGLQANATTGQLSDAGGWLGWNVLAPVTAEFEVLLSTQGDGLVQFIVDGADFGPPTTAGITLTSRTTLTRGLHSLRVQRRTGPPSAATVVSLIVRQAGSPNAPTLLASQDGDSRVTLRWQPPADGSAPTGYLVRYGTTPGTYTREFDAGAATQADITGLANNQTVFFTVVARNASGFSLPSNELGTTPFANGQESSLVLFEFTGQAGDVATARARATSSRVIAGELQRGPGLKPTIYLDVAANTFGSQAANANELYAQTLAESVTRQQHYEFTVAPAIGRRLAVTQLRFRPYFQNVTGLPDDPRGAGVSFSTNGVDFAAVPVGGTPSYFGTSEFSLDLSGQTALQAVSDAVTFRIHLFGNGPYEFTGLGGPGDDLVVVGSVSSTTQLKLPALSAEVVGNTLRLRFASEAGVIYMLQHSGTFSDWRNGRSVTGDGALAELEEPLNESAQYYRLVLP